ncbi:MAG: 4'-phosphopantetheinyl transferase superfamily protein [Candidatus Riflebacteria bacterium]|nr:4'-phosphopantetheinyl transferase superfamily protein [Candidatus Riflebacteria bacterium]
MQKLSFFDNTAQIYIICSDDFIKPDSLDLSYFISTLSDEEKDRFSRYKNENAQFTFLTARFYLRNILSKIIENNAASLRVNYDVSHNLENEIDIKKINYEASNLIIEISPSGKPYLKDYPTLFFNISHTDGLILLGFANSPIGVDVEKIERNADKEAIIKHFFSEKEQQSFFSQPDNQRQLAFVKGWTRKEAILKATGDGLSAMKDFEVSFEPETDMPLIMKNNKFKIKDFTPLESYAGCVALL